MPQQTDIHPPLNTIPAEISCARDYQALAAQFIPADRLAYIAGGSGHDITLENNQRVYHDYALTPHLFSNSSDATPVSTGVELFSQTFQHPFFLAPVAYQTLVHPQGELASAQAAAATDSNIIASTLSAYPLEKIAEQASQARWFQLYLQANPKDTDHLLQRAQSAGYQAIVLTVDAAVQVPSLRAVRAGFRFPAEIQAANLQNAHQQSASTSVYQTYQQNAVTLLQIRQLLAQTDLPVIVKGVLNPDDAQQLQELGVAGIVVSNHGGRTVDGVPASLAVLASIRERVGLDYPLLFDGGIRSGSDAFKAIALGADAVLIGRLQLYALAIAGALGVAHMLKLLREEFELAMAISGCADIQTVKTTQLFLY